MNLLLNFNTFITFSLLFSCKLCALMQDTMHYTTLFLSVDSTLLAFLLILSSSISPVSSFSYLPLLYSYTLQMHLSLYFLPSLYVYFHFGLQLTLFLVRYCVLIRLSIWYWWCYVFLQPICQNIFSVLYGDNKYLSYLILSKGNQVSLIILYEFPDHMIKVKCHLGSMNVDIC